MTVWGDSIKSQTSSQWLLTLIVTSSCDREHFQAIRNDYGLVDGDYYSQVTAGGGGGTGVLNESPLQPLFIQKSETDPGYFSLMV